MNGALPEGWASVKLRELTTKVGSGATPRGGSVSYQSTGTALIRSQNVRFEGFTSDGLVYLSPAQADGLKGAMVRSRDVLLNITGASIGRVTQAPTEMEGARVNQHVCIIRPIADVVPQFLALYLSSPSVQEMIWTEQYGVTRQALTKEQILNFDVLLTPKAEQERLTGKIEAMLAKVRSSQRRLDRIPTTLKRFRQSIVAAACTGRLTADWRSRHGKEGSVDEMPVGWRKVLVRDVIADLKYGTAQKCTPEKLGTPVLRIPNVANGTIDHSDLKYAVLPPREIKTLCLVPGDILIIRSNGSVSLVGRSAVVGKQEKGFAYAGYLIRVRPKQTIIEPEFLNLVLGSYDVRLQIEVEARSTSGVNNINSEEVRSLQFLMPELDEQQEVVRKVEAMLAPADRLEARYLKAKAQVDRLAQSILAKAFRGELVPTEAELARREGREYETAEQLLNRINSETRADSANGRPRRTTRARRK